MASQKILAVIYSTITSISTAVILAIFNVPDPLQEWISSLTQAMNLISNTFQNTLPANATQAHAIMSSVNSNGILAINILGFFVIIEPVLTVCSLIYVVFKSRNENEYNPEYYG